jgi:hypothetical protein
MIAVHVGRRGRVLLFFGCLDLVYAVSLTAPDAEIRRTSFFVWLAGIAPLWVWAIAWGGVGVVCVWQAFCRRDRVGFAAATCLKVFWGLVCLGGWLFGGMDRGYVSAVIWLGLAYLMARVLAPWPEPGDLKGPTWIRPSPSR